MLRIGVIGHGERVSAVIKDHFREHDPDLRVVGIVDPNEQAARERLAECDRKDAEFYPTLKEMADKAKLDAIVIGTLCDLHTQNAIEASQYGLPIFLEKPVSVNMEQAVALERAFENSPCEVVVSFPMRVAPLCALAKEYMDRGAVGEPQHVMASNYVSYGTTSYFDCPSRDYKHTQGMFLQKATHDLDYLMYLVDSPIVRVAAMAGRGRIFGGDKPAGLWCSECDEQDRCLESPQNRKKNWSVGAGRLGDHRCLFSPDMGTPETGMNEESSSALLEFACGAQGVYTQVFFTRRMGMRGATISGYHGTLTLDYHTNKLHHIRHHQPYKEALDVESSMSHYGGDTELGRNFVAVVKGKEKSKTPIETGLRSVYACLAAKQSANTGQFVNVRQLGK